MSTVLQKLTLNAYRGISGLALDNLTSVSLVVGANNSGKSSILEAVGLFLRPPDPTQWVNAVRHRDVDMSLVDGLWSVFPSSEALHPEDGLQESTPLIIEGSVSGNPRRVEARCFASQTLDATETADLSARIEVSVNGDPALTLKFPSPAVGAYQVPMYRIFTVTPATHYSTKALVEHLSRVIDEGKKQFAVELLQVFDKDVEDLDIIASLGREAVRVTHRTRGVVDLASFGDGMRRSAALALALTRASQGVLLIDEIETGIHSNLLRPVLSKLLVAAAASQVQLLATTHSLEAVDALIAAVADQNSGNSFATYWVQRKDGRHEARRYNFERLQRMREGGLDVR
jgi:energy-coupling factor transporter ATP-binding protein EcfA2